LSAFRNVLRNKLYTVLNIVGLSIGLATFIFILLYVRDELAYDKYHEKHARIHRIESDFTIAGSHDQFAIVPIPLGPAFKIEFPEIESFARFMDVGEVLFRYNEKEYYEADFYVTDSTVFDIFTHEFVVGSPENALTDPNTIVLTESVSKKYFGNENPMGEVLISGEGTNYKVSAVIKDLPVNSHLKFGALLSAATIAERIGADEFNSLEPERFWNIGVYTFILLNKNADIQAIHDRMPAFYEKYMKAVGDSFNASFNLLSTPLAETHFASGLGAELPTGNMSYIYIFSAIAIFILLIAAINYMNMATARSAKRAREVGIRKVVGAYRSQVVRQFLSESVLLTLIALVIALLIVFMLLNDFNLLSGKELTLNFFSRPDIFLPILIVTIFVGIVSGSYPAFYLSSYRPIEVLKGRISGSGKRAGLMRKVLVVIQFFIAIVMIIATMTVSDQLDFLRNKDLGFNKDNLITMELQDSAFRSKAPIFKEELLLNSNITDVTVSSGVPGRLTWIQVVLVEKEEGMNEQTMMIAMADHEFADAMGLDLLQGRHFDREMGTDLEEAVLINEAAVKSFGWTDDPLGKKIQWGMDLDRKGGRMLKVIGVVRDFNFKSLHNEIEPLMIILSENPMFLMSVRIKDENVTETLAFLEDKWNEFDAGRPFSYNFLSEDLDSMYEEEGKIARIFRITAFLTIFIALLGLLGLSSFVAEQRFKEIGIRKVLGASVGNVVGLLLKEFVILFLISFVLAVPIAWWRLDIWLDSTFVYHGPFNWLIFVAAGLLALVIGLLTMSFFVVKAASSNPVEAIGYE